MTEYKIVFQDSIRDLDRVVNQYIKMGWRPIGGVAVAERRTIGYGAFNCFQAIVKG